MAMVINPVITAAMGSESTNAVVAAHPIDEKASAKVANRDEVWRRRNWLRRACMRNQSWVAGGGGAAAMTPAAVTAACCGDANSSAITSGANKTPITSNTSSIFARISCEGGNGAAVTRSGASSPEIVSHPRPPAMAQSALMIKGATREMATELSLKLRHSSTAGGTR